MTDTLPACRRSTTILRSAAQMLSFLRNTVTVVFPCKRAICIDICKKRGFDLYCQFSKKNVTQRRDQKLSRQLAGGVQKPSADTCAKCCCLPGMDGHCLKLLGFKAVAHFAFCISLFADLGAGRREEQLATFPHCGICYISNKWKAVLKKAPRVGLGEKEGALARCSRVLHLIGQSRLNAKADV